MRLADALATCVSIGMQKAQLHRGSMRQSGKQAPERIGSLREAAGFWVAEHDLPCETLRCAIDAGHRACFLQVLTRCVPDWLRAGEYAELLHWTGQLSIDELVSCSPIRDAHLMSLILLRQFERLAIEAAAQAVRASRDPHAWRAQAAPARCLQEIAVRLADDTRAEAQSPACASGGSPALTQRELELLRLLSLGLSNRDISARCKITLFTTKWHLKNVFAKLSVSTRIEALCRAQQLKLFDHELVADEMSRAPTRAGHQQAHLWRSRDAGARSRRSARKRDLLSRDQGEQAE